MAAALAGEVVDVEMLTSRLSALETTGLIRLAQAQPELEYLFRHALVQDAAYQSILKQDRKRLHLAVAETLEALYPERLEELAPLLADHFAEAKDEARAFHYFCLAGDHALHVYANIEAEQYFRAALALATAAQDRARLLKQIGQALYGQGRFAEAVAVWKDAIQAYRALRDYDGVAWLYADSARAASNGGDTPTGLSLCREGLAAAGEARDSGAIAALLHEAARESFFTGQQAEARRFGERALDMARRLGDVAVEADTLATLGILRDQPVNRQIETLERAVELAETADLPATASRAHNNLSSILITTTGDLLRAREHTLRAVEMARRMGTLWRQFFFLNNLVELTLELGDFAQGEALLLQLRGLLSAIGSTDTGRHLPEVYQARLLRFNGAFSEAAARLRACATVIREQRDLQSLYTADHYLADVLLEMNEWAAAESVLQEAIEIGDQGVGEGGVLPRTLLATALVGQGRLAEAQSVLRETREKIASDPAPVYQEAILSAEARLAAAERRWEESLAAYSAVASLQQTTGKRWHHAYTLNEMAEAHTARGEPDDLQRARILLEQAATEFKEIGVPYYVARVQERMQSLFDRMLRRD